MAFRIYEFDQGGDLDLPNFDDDAEEMVLKRNNVTRQDEMSAFGQRHEYQETLSLEDSNG